MIADGCCQAICRFGGLPGKAIVLEGIGKWRGERWWVIWIGIEPGNDALFDQDQSYR